MDPDPTNSPQRALIVSSHPLFGQGLRSLLEEREIPFEMVGIVSTIEAAMAILESDGLDIVIVDYDDEALNREAFVARFLESEAEVRVVLLSLKEGREGREAVVYDRRTLAAQLRVVEARARTGAGLDAHGRAERGQLNDRIRRDGDPWLGGILRGDRDRDHARIRSSQIPSPRWLRREGQGEGSRLRFPELRTLSPPAGREWGWGYSKKMAMKTRITMTCATKIIVPRTNDR